MAQKKTFDRGQVVEYQEDPGSTWKLAVYDKPREYGPRQIHHRLDFLPESPPRYVDVNGTPMPLRWVIVPSRRIRPKPETSGMHPQDEDLLVLPYEEK
jgi:hypothetical protein